MVLKYYMMMVLLLVRKSNTTPNITTRYEAKTKERLEEITNEYNSLLDKLKRRRVIINKYYKVKREE